MKNIIMAVAFLMLSLSTSKAQVMTTQKKETFTVYLKSANLFSLSDYKGGVSLEATKGKCDIWKQEDKEVVVYPTETGALELVVKNKNNQVVETITCRVVAPPMPYVNLYSNAGEIDVKKTVSLASLSNLKAEVQAEESFRQYLPNDANYQIKAVRVNQIRGGQSINQLESEQAGVSLQSFKWIKGDIMSIRVKYERKSGLGELFPETQIFNIAVE